MTRITKKKFKEALVGTYGIQSSIAKKIGVTRGAITIFLNKNPDLRELCHKERDKIIDIAENKLFDAINKGQQWAINKTLSTIGNVRGYAPKQELEHTTKDFEIHVNIPKEVKELLDGELQSDS